MFAMRAARTDDADKMRQPVPRHLHGRDQKRGAESAGRSAACGRLRRTHARGSGRMKGRERPNLLGLNKPAQQARRQPQRHIDAQRQVLARDTPPRRTAARRPAWPRRGPSNRPNRTTVSNEMSAARNFDTRNAATHPASAEPQRTPAAPASARWCAARREKPPERDHARQDAGHGATTPSLTSNVIQMSLSVTYSG